MKKRIILLLTVVIAAAGFVFYVVKDKGHESAADVSVNTESGDQLLVSITNTDLLTKYYENDKVIHEEELTGYPAFALDQKQRVLYYTGNNDQNEMRLFKLDLKSNKKMMLYKGAESADSLFLSRDRSTIYFRLGKADESNFRIASFDLKTKKYKNLYPAVNDQDDSVSSFFYNKKTDSFAFLHYSVEEDYKKTDEANEKGIDPEPTTIHFASGRQNKFDELKSLDQFISDIAVSDDDKRMLFTSYTQKGTEQTASIQMLKADTKKYENIISNQKNFKLLIDAQPQFSKDGKKIYFLAEAKGAKKLKDETGREAKVRTIYSYNLGKKTFKKVWENPNGIINSFSVIS
ncbi:PD40 domain-containing protein [Bacillus vallismortis]|uniref:PD40 domain-containing protein n=1 Tax=Bacillus vallismortis TaxID=72361 RepID=A0ABY4Y0J0_BACVA|nr:MULTISPECIES: PD40 domain-containing protein [Bacillus subtilis group]USP96109.1 PD40 domain-containing protein [Bacillus vallismortis]